MYTAYDVLKCNLEAVIAEVVRSFDEFRCPLEYFIEDVTSARDIAHGRL